MLAQLPAKAKHLSHHAEAVMLWARTGIDSTPEDNISVVGPLQMQDRPKIAAITRGEDTEGT
jgi:hypothetical protein